MCRIRYCLASVAAILVSGGAQGAELRYQLDGLGGAPSAATCDGCFQAMLARPQPTGLELTPAARAAAASLVPGGAPEQRRTTGVSPTAMTNPADRSGWVDVRLEADPAEPVSFVMGMNVADRNDVAMDNLARNEALRFPSTRVVAGMRFDLGRER